MTTHAPKPPFHSISDHLKLKICIQKLGINICFYKSTQQILALLVILLYQAETLFTHLLWYPLYNHLSVFKHCWRFEYVEAFVVAVLHLSSCGKISPLSQRWHLLHNHLIAIAPYPSSSTRSSLECSTDHRLACQILHRFLIRYISKTLSTLLHLQSHASYGSWTPQ